MMDVVDGCEESSLTTSVSPRSTDETRSNTSHSTDIAHHKPTATSVQSATTASEVGPSSRRDHRSRQEQPSVEQRAFVLQQASTEASDPSRHLYPVWNELDESHRPSSRTGVAAGDEDGTVDVEDLNVVDAGQNGVDDCLITSLRAEVS